MKLDTLEALYVDELRDLWSAESQIVKALPKMVKAAAHKNLKKAFAQPSASRRSISGGWSGSSATSG